MVELQAEEQLVSVMRRMAAKEPVSDAEMAEAATTYERYTGETGDEPDLRGTQR